jgi:UDP-sugar pyrophosphorylase
MTNFKLARTAYAHTRWLCFSPVKNNIIDAAQKAAKDLPPECAGTAERDAYYLNARVLSMSGVDVPLEGKSGVFGGVPITFPPLITLLPSFGTCMTEINAHVGNDASVTISPRSAVTISGDVDIPGVLEVDGALVVKAVEGAKVTIKKLLVRFVGVFALCL